MVEGLVAVHDPGNFRGLCRPFGDRPEDGWIWSVEEADDPGAAPSRAFTPVISDDRRHIVFSTPHRVSALDLWKRRELSGCKSEGVERALDLKSLGAELIASPIPLEAGKVGLVILADEPRWFVWDTASADEDLAPRVRAALAQDPMKITGRRCHAVVLEGAAIAFSTSDGHWVWPMEDALKSDVGAIINTWSGDATAGDRIPVPSDPRDDRPQAQAFSTGNLHGGHDRVRFEWYFQVVSESQRNAPKILFYEVVLKDRSRPIPEVFSKHDAKPLAVLDGELLYEGDGATLYQRRAGPAQITQYPGVMVESLVSFALQGRLLLMEGSRMDSEAGAGRGRSLGRFLRVSSLGPQPGNIEAKLGDMRSKPLFWSGWIFTAEVVDGVLASVGER